MPKAVLSNRIFLEVDAVMEQDIRKELTYEIPCFMPGLSNSTIVLKTYAKVRQGLMSVPIGRMDLIPDGYDVIDRRITVPAEFPKFRGTLRPEQQKIYDEIEDNAILNAWVSFGKTFTALAIAEKFGQKTLVVTHTTSLRDQWVKEIEKVYGFTPGIIGSGSFDLSTPIVVGNVQTLHKRMGDLYKEFGFLIIDEMHHCSSNTFTKVLDKSAAMYKLGLSGTIQRKDGKHVTFFDYFGTNLFQPPKENYMVPTVEVYKTCFKLVDSQTVPWANKVNKILFDPEYQKLVSILAAKYAAQGHKVLVVADRVEFLTNCAELIGSNAICVTGMTKNRDELLDSIKLGHKDILLGTQSIFSEGISVNELSCLILATPVNNAPLLTQLAGRVLRLCENKKDPIIVDLNFLGNTAVRQGKARAALYLSEGWRIKYQ